MTERREPPMRLDLLSQEIEAFGCLWLVSVMPDGAGRPVEVSVNDPANSLKDSDAHRILQDCAQVASYALQLGLPLEGLALRLGRACPADPLLPARAPVGDDGKHAASVIGAMIEVAVALTREMWLPLEPADG